MPHYTEVPFESFDVTIPKALDAIGAAEILSKQTGVLIKPNLVNASPPPITTPPDAVAVIIEYIQASSDATIVVGEGCGDPQLDTDAIFDRLGYSEMADRYGVTLMDLNHAPLRKMEDKQCTVFQEMYLPEIAFSHYLISVPVLKAHSLADLTGSLKNMMGLVPPSHYSGRYGSWKKAAFHGQMQESIVDLNRYRTPDLTVMDASIGMPDFHLGGPHCDPPLNRIIAGYDPVEIDRRGAELLNLRWQSIGHLR